MPSKIIGILDHRKRRRDKRRTSPQLNIRLQGGDYLTENWSLGGFLIDGYEGPLKPGDECNVEISAEVRGKAVTVHATIEVMRINRDAGELAAHFVRFPPGQFELLEKISTRGRL